MRGKLKKLLRERLVIHEEDYFNPTLPDDIKDHSHKYEGRSVTWYGDPDQMIVIHKDNVHGMWGNVYDPEKMDFLVDMIINHEDKVELECSYGIGGIIDLTDVIEEQTSFHNGSFDVDYENLDEPHTTGDNELDEYLGKEDLSEFDDISIYVENYDLFDLFSDNKTYLAKGRISLEDFKQAFEKISDGSEEDIEAFKQFIKYENEVKQAIDNGSGDLGNFTVQLRDGHHRVMSAIKAGEEYVCVNLDTDSIVDYKGYYKKV
jgi:hypothetical protein